MGLGTCPPETGYNNTFILTLALRVAVQMGNEQAFDLLLEKGADPSSSELIT
jgi:hypothetical protein